MKLSKSYLLKKSKSDFHFHLSIFVIEKRLPNSVSRQLADSTRRLPDLPTHWVVNSAYRGVPDWVSQRLPNSASRRLPDWAIRESPNMTILGYSCGLQSSLYTKNHHYTCKVLIFYIKSLSIKKDQAIKVAKILT